MREEINPACQTDLSSGIKGWSPAALNELATRLTDSGNKQDTRCAQTEENIHKQPDIILPDLIDILGLIDWYLG